MKSDIQWTMTVGDVAQRSGVAVSALRFYEAKGLITSQRSVGNQRRYERAVLRRVAVIRTAQRVGISLEQIAAALDSLPKGQAPTRADWSRLSRLWRDDLNQRIVQLEKLRDTLDDCIGCGCLSLQRCALRNPGDTLASAGPGAHRLQIKSKA